MMRSHSHGRGNLALNTKNVSHSHNTSSPIYNANNNNHAHTNWGWTGGGNRDVYDLSINFYVNTNLNTGGANGFNHTHGRDNINSVSDHNHPINQFMNNTGNSEAFDTIPEYLTGFFIIRIK